MNLLIRDARPDDHDGLTHLLRHPCGGDGLVGPARQALLDDEPTDGAYDTLTDVLVAVDRTERLLGTATLSLPGGGSNGATPPARAATLHMLGVVPTTHGRAVGAALVAESVARARLAGAFSLDLHTTDAIAAAHRLDTTSGFTRAPENDTREHAGGTLRAYRRRLDPWPLIRVAQSGEYVSAGELTVAAYVGAGLLPADHAYVHQLADAARRAAEAELLVAVDPAGGLLGTVTYCPPGSAYREIGLKHEGEFRMLAVSPPAHGRGIGEALVRTCLRRARAEGMRGVAISSATAMHVAHRLYERLGFARDPRRDWTPEPSVSLLAYARDI